MPSVLQWVAINPVLECVYIMQLLPANLSVDKLSPAQQQTVARQRLKQLVTNRKQELQHFACILLQAYAFLKALFYTDGPFEILSIIMCLDISDCFGVEMFHLWRKARSI